MDTGRYECSVNTLPKISHTVDLVVEDEVMDMVMQDSPDNWSAMWHEKLQVRHEQISCLLLQKKILLKSLNPVRNSDWKQSTNLQ